MSAPASAQEITLNENATTTDDVEYDQEIDRQTRIVEWEYDTDRKGFDITIEADTRTVLTLTESVQFSEGSGSGSIFEQRLPAGTSAVFVPVEPRAGEAALTITTPASIQNSRYVYVSTGQAATGGPWSTTSSAAGWFGGLSVALTMMIGAAWQAKRRDHDTPEDYT